MSDKRQEFIGEWCNTIFEQTDDKHGGLTYEGLWIRLEKMLVEYDKLKSDKWEGLKEYLILYKSYYVSRKDDLGVGKDDCLSEILAEIERIEKEGK